MCASVLYGQGEYQQALAKLQAAMDSREYLVRTQPNVFGWNQVNSGISPGEWGDILVLRGQIRSVLGDRIGGLQDLTSGIEQYSLYRKQVEEWSHSSNSKLAENAREILASPGLSLQTAKAYQYRAVTLLRLERYAEANRDYNSRLSFSLPPYLDSSKDPTLKELGDAIRAGLAAGEISSQP